jgi:hypothetical protein
MTGDADPLLPGHGVDVSLELENRGSTSQRVGLDEIVSGLLDDARIDRLAASSSVDVVIVRMGHDRLALTGSLAPGATVVVTYRAVLDDAATGGDGVLSRTIVGADDGAPPCGATTTPTAAEGLGVCTVIAPTTSTSTMDATLASAPVENVIEITPEAGEVISADDTEEWLVSVPGLLAAAIGGAFAIVLGLLIVARRRASARRRRESWGAGPAAPAPHTLAMRGHTPLDPGRSADPVAYTSRRERRLAESRSAVPVA